MCGIGVVMFDDLHSDVKGWNKSFLPIPHNAASVKQSYDKVIINLFLPISRMAIERSGVGPFSDFWCGIMQLSSKLKALI